MFGYWDRLPVFLVVYLLPEDEGYSLIHGTYERNETCTDVLEIDSLLGVALEAPLSGSSEGSTAWS